MRYLSLLLLVLFCNCTNSKNQNEIDSTVYDMWGDFIESNPEFAKDALPDSWYFHMNEEDANRLGDLVVMGKKQASSNLYFWYEEANADLQKIDTKHIITDFDGKALAIISITKVDTVPFNQISKAYAELDMGTKTAALKKWKKAHWDFFAGAMKQEGEEPTTDMLIVCEWFETIWTDKNSSQP